MTKLELLRKAITTAQKTKRSDNTFDYFNMEPEQSCTVRFLPDANNENPLFWIAKATHYVPVNGQDKSITCLKNYNEECPICKLSQRFYNKNEKDIGKQLYRKLTHIAQVLVIADPFDDDKSSVGQYKLINLSPQIIKIIKNEILDEEQFDVMPTDYKSGVNFVIRKSKQGEYASYINSKFARKSTALTKDQIEYVSGKIVDLATLIPTRPADEEYETIIADCDIM